MEGASLEQDPRWAKLHDRSWLCPCCGQAHAGLPDLVCSKPDAWPRSDEKAPNSAILSHPDDVLTEDFCILDGQHHFVRAVLYLPIVGTTGKRFGFGVWSTLSKANFERYVETFDSDAQGDLGPWSGWFSNGLKGYPDSLNIRCQVLPQDGGQRPQIEIAEAEHLLAQEQRRGITFDRVLDLLALHGHDIRPGLGPST